MLILAATISFSIHVKKLGQVKFIEEFIGYESIGYESVALNVIPITVSYQLIALGILVVGGFLIALSCRLIFVEENPINYEK